MKVINILGHITYCFVIILAFFGAVILSVAVHEYSHIHDFKNFSVEDEEVCILNLSPNVWSGRIGYYDFTFQGNKKDWKELHKVEKYTEIKATIFTIIFLAIVFFAIIFDIQIRTSK